MCDCMQANHNPEDYGTTFAMCRKQVSVKYRLFKINNYYFYCDRDVEKYNRFIDSLSWDTIDSARVFSLSASQYMHRHCCDVAPPCPAKE